ncbi:MAG: type II secretion system protein [Minisyncoccota bacterium]
MKYIYNLHKKRGFTLVELMVSISIIGLLSTIVFASFSQAQKKARTAKIVSDLKQMQVALEYYYSVNKAYPIVTTGTWISECKEAEPAGTNIIPGLVPYYINKIPTAPRSSPNPGSNRNLWEDCYVYRSSDGTWYAFIAHGISGFTAQDYLAQPELMDPIRDGGTNDSVVDGVTPWAWKVYSPGGVNQ